MRVEDAVECGPAEAAPQKQLLDKLFNQVATANATHVSGGKTAPVPIAQIINAITAKSDGEPRRVGTALFVHD